MTTYIRKNILPVTRLQEKLISSATHTQMVFDEITTEHVRDILINKSKQFLGTPQIFSKLPLIEQERKTKKFLRSIIKPLNDIPHFRHNKIHFETDIATHHNSIFGNGYQHVFWTIIAVLVNEAVTPETLVEAMRDNFEKELMRLRAVIRHELSHRLEMEHIHHDPVKRMKKYAYKKAITAPKGHDSYYGEPTEIRAHANHAVELLMQGHMRGWREVLSNYVLRDTSPGHKDTRKLVKYISKLFKDYNVPFTKRFLLRHELLTLTRQMRLKLPELEGEDLKNTRDTIAQVNLSPEFQDQFTTVRLHNKSSK